MEFKTGRKFLRFYNQEDSGAIIITTEYMTIKIVPEQAHLMWWFGNRSSNTEMYKLQLTKIQEFVGDDDVLDSRTELVGISYNLITENWAVDEIVEGEDELEINLSLTGLANGADMKLIMHVYNEDTTLSPTGETIEGLTELKFDIIVDNWDFSTNAKGIAIQTYLEEVQNRHRVTVRNGTNDENGNHTRTMMFESDSYSVPVAYFEWATVADIYNDSEIKIDEIDVGTTYFDELIDPPTGGLGFEEGLAHLFLTYPNYGDGYKMVHDPSIGINEEAYSESISLFLVPVLSGLFALTAVIAIIKKRRK